MRDLITDSSCSNTSLNFNDFYFHNPRKLGKRKQEARNQRLEAAGEHARRRRCCEDALPKIALDVSSARTDRDWVQKVADSCHRLQRTSGEPREHTSRWLSHH